MTDKEILKLSAQHLRASGAFGTSAVIFGDVEFARAIIAQARADLIAEITAPGPVAYKWRTAARFKTGTPGPWHLSLDRFDPVPHEVDEIACYAIPKE